MLLVANCCCWGSAVVDIPFVPDAPTVVCVLSVVGIRAVAGTMLVLTFLLLLGP
jgi:hypothetical protein